MTWLPERPDPSPVPMADGGGSLWERLRDQRRILVSGRLEERTVTDLAAQLMAFDGSSSRDVEMTVTSSGGSLGAIFPLLDVVGLMRARVNVTAIGSVHATAVGLVTTCIALGIVDAVAARP